MMKMVRRYLEKHDLKRRFSILKDTLWRWPYRLLLIISFVIFLIHLAILGVASPSQVVWGPLTVQFSLTWTGRLSASIGSAYLTSAIVDGVFRARDREKQQAQATAFKQLAVPLRFRER